VGQSNAPPIPPKNRPSRTKIPASGVAPASHLIPRQTVVNDAVAPDLVPFVVPRASSSPPAWIPSLSTPVLEYSYMIESSKVRAALSQIKTIDGFVAASLVDAESSMMLGSESNGSTLNLEVASALNTEVVKAKQRAAAALNLNDSIEDILITLGKQYHLIRPSKQFNSLFFYVVLDRTKSNLAMARMALANAEKSLV
jgi:hypothetical protein